MKKRWISLGLTALLALALAGCKGSTKESTAPAPSQEGSSQAQSLEGAKKEQQAVTFVLDWTPNTNHTGIYVALEKGYYKEAGIDLEIVQPPEDGAEVLTASGKADFGISFQDTMSAALTGDSPLPITAVAALVQHNTSGIISRKGEGMDHPKGLEGKKYATWNMDIEKAMLKTVVEEDGGDFSKVELIPSTVTDEVTALNTKQVDAIWIFYGWAGIAAKEKGLDFDYFAFKDLKAVFDYYTPVLIANNDLLKNHPEEAKAFLEATKRGYEDAISDPDGAAEILLKYAPELDETIVKKSQEYLSAQYQADASRWGEIDGNRWAGFYTWLNDNQLLASPIDVKGGFTNDYLPQ